MTYSTGPMRLAARAVAPIVGFEPIVILGRLHRQVQPMGTESAPRPAGCGRSTSAEATIPDARDADGSRPTEADT